MKDIKDKLFKTKTGEMVYTQRPNIPILFALLFWAISLIAWEGFIKELAHLAFLFFLGVWAVMEIFAGVNLFRKVLGSLAVIYILYSIFFGLS